MDVQGLEEGGELGLVRLRCRLVESNRGWWGGSGEFEALKIG